MTTKEKRTNIKAETIESRKKLWTILNECDEKLESILLTNLEKIVKGDLLKQEPSATLKNKIGRTTKRITVKQVLESLDFNSSTNYEIRGIYTGKIYYRSWTDEKEYMEQFYNDTVPDTPLYPSLRITRCSYPTFVIGIWMNDMICINKDYIR